MFITFNRNQAIELLRCNVNARPIRIKQGLESKGYFNVQTVGRGSNLMFVCEVEEESDAQCYGVFKEICINEYGYGANFDYDKVLEVIDSHINNKEFTSLKKIAEDIGISEKTIHKHRERLCGKILKSTKDCDKRIFGRNSVTQLAEDITEIYEEIILNSYKKELAKITTRFPKGNYYEVAIFRNKKNKSFELYQREKDSFKMLKESMEDSGNEYIASYPVWVNLYYEQEMSSHLKQKVFQLILQEFGYDFAFFLRLYEITEDLKYDEEFLNVITKAIRYSKSKSK